MFNKNPNKNVDKKTYEKNTIDLFEKVFGGSPVLIGNTYVHNELYTFNGVTIDGDTYYSLKLGVTSTPATKRKINFGQEYGSHTTYIKTFFENAEPNFHYAIFFKYSGNDINKCIEGLINAGFEYWFHLQMFDTFLRGGDKDVKFISDKGLANDINAAKAPSIEPREVQMEQPAQETQPKEWFIPIDEIKLSPEAKAAKEKEWEEWARSVGLARITYFHPDPTCLVNLVDSMEIEPAFKDVTDNLVSDSTDEITELFNEFIIDYSTSPLPNGDRPEWTTLFGDPENEEEVVLNDLLNGWVNGSIDQLGSLIQPRSIDDGYQSGGVDPENDEIEMGSWDDIYRLDGWEGGENVSEWIETADHEFTAMLLDKMASVPPQMVAPLQKAVLKRGAKAKAIKTYKQKKSENCRTLKTIFSEKADLTGKTRYKRKNNAVFYACNNEFLITKNKDKLVYSLKKLVKDAMDYLDYVFDSTPKGTPENTPPGTLLYWNLDGTVATKTNEKGVLEYIHIYDEEGAAKKDTEKKLEDLASLIDQYKTTKQDFTIEIYNGKTNKKEDISNILSAIILEKSSKATQATQTAQVVPAVPAQ